MTDAIPEEPSVAGRCISEELRQEVESLVESKLDERVPAYVEVRLAQILALGGTELSARKKQFLQKTMNRHSDTPAELKRSLEAEQVLTRRQLTEQQEQCARLQELVSSQDRTCQASPSVEGRRSQGLR